MEYGIGKDLNDPPFDSFKVPLIYVLISLVFFSPVFSVALVAKSKSRVPLLCYVVANVISIILWGVSLLFIDSNSHFALWYIGLFVELIVNLIVRDNKRLSWAASHLAERFGLLTLIVLGM
jgi:low temperature requirement protein LtrA